MKKLLMAILGFMFTASAQARADVRVGTLSCDIAPTISFIIGSSQRVACVYASNRGRREQYVGRLSRFGADLGATSGKKFIWAVVAPASNERGALSGTYIGASGEATFGVGAHANVLFGGSGRTLALQPLSFGAQQGLGVAATLSGLELTPRR